MTAAPPPPREEDGEPSAVSDAVWDEFVRDTEKRIRAEAPKEPSARARLAAARRRRAKEPEKWEPKGWRTGPAWREMRRREQRPWRRAVRSAAVVVAVAAVTLVALDPAGARSLARGHGFTWHGSGTDADDTPLAPETGKPTAAPPAAGGVPTVAHPWAGSPALRWADGADGIVLPKAAAVGKVPAAEVAEALRATKAYLVGTNLDPAVLRGGYPTAALRLVELGTSLQIKASVSTKSKESDADWWLTRYHPSEVALVGTVVKVRGHMAFDAGDGGFLRVHTDYNYVYAFTKTSHPDGPVERVVVRRVLDAVWLPEPFGKLRVVPVDSSLANSSCGYEDGYLHPHFDSDGGPVPSGPATDPYDRSKPLPTTTSDGGCGAVSRT